MAHCEEAATVAFQLAHGALDKCDSIIDNTHALIRILGQGVVGPEGTHVVTSRSRPKEVLDFRLEAHSHATSDCLMEEV